MPNKENFCCFENYSILVPYSDFVKMMEMGTKFDEMHKMFVRMCKQYDAMKVMYSEMLEKIDEINHYL